MKRKTTKTLCLICLFLSFSYFGIGQTQFSTKEFWYDVQINYDNNVGASAWLCSIVNSESNSLPDALAKLETLSKNEALQDKIFLTAYTGYHNNLSGLEMIFGILCGSYSIGNPVAEYVFAKYSKDPRALKIIADADHRNEENLKKEQEKEEKEKEQKIAKEKAKEEAKKKEDERPFEMEKQRFHEYLEKKILDSKMAISSNPIEWASLYGITPPRFKEILGDDVWDKYLNSQGIFQSQKKSDDKEVIVSFVINIDGDIEYETVEWSQGEEYDTKAIEIIKNTSGKWVPAKGKRNKKVNYTLYLPVRF